VALVVKVLDHAIKIAVAERARQRLPYVEPVENPAQNSAADYGDDSLRPARRERYYIEFLVLK
jgi:hypothetical protein